MPIGRFNAISIALQKLLPQMDRAMNKEYCVFVCAEKGIVRMIFENVILSIESSSERMIAYPASYSYNQALTNYRSLKHVWTEL